jgi:hypothetical protein
MKTEAIRSGSASLLAFRPSEPRGRRGREGEGRIRLRKYIHIRRSPVALGEKTVSQKSWEKRNPRRKLSRAVVVVVVVVRQPKRYKRSRQSRLDSNLSL